MAFFTKTDPALKLQRDLETKLKAKRTNRDDLVERRKLAEVNAASHREKACKLASDGADDAGLSAAETAMRREQDRIATLSDAITKIDAAITDLEKEIAQIVDQRCRAETAAAVATLVDKWVSAGAAFDAAVSQLAELARESAVIIVDAHPLQVFLEALQKQVSPEIDLVTSVLRTHASAVLAGTAPPSLPKPAAEPAQLKVVEPPEPTETLFCLKSIKWRDRDGVLHVVDQYCDASVPTRLVKRAREYNAAVSVTDPRRRQSLNAHGGRHPNPDYAVDLDDEAATRPSHIAPVMASDPLASADFRVIDRSAEARTLTIEVPRL